MKKIGMFIFIIVVLAIGSHTSLSAILGTQICNHSGSKSYRVSLSSYPRSYLKPGQCRVWPSNDTVKVNQECMGPYDAPKTSTIKEFKIPKIDAHLRTAISIYGHNITKSGKHWKHIIPKCERGI